MGVPMIYELLAGAAGLTVIGGCALAWRATTAAGGYQDASGFHYGDEPFPSPTASAAPAPWHAGFKAPTLAPANENLLIRLPYQSLPYTLTPDQQLVLREMSEEIGPRASTLARNTGLPEGRVSIIRRELANMGLAFYGPLVDVDSGRPNGSGYLLTPDGAAVRNAMPETAMAA